MRHIKNILAGTFALATVALVAGCIKEDYIGTCEQPEAGDITIVASLDKMKLTKATVEDNATERTITHIDIFVVDSEGNIDWYERNADGNDKTQGQGNGYLKLSQKRTTKVNGNYLFEQGEEYKIYLLANSAQTEATMKSLLTKDALEALVEQTEKVYCTGMEDEAPQTFLMDAVAKLGNSASIEINPVTTPTEHLELKATFNRAASKVIVNIKQGTEVRFVPEGINSVLPQAEFNNLATKTSVLQIISPLADAGLVNSEAKNVDNKVLAWDADTKTYTVTAYTYSHLWEEGADNESALIVNIPMLWDEDGKDEAGNLEIDDQAPESWYKIPLSQDNEFGRNYCYIVNLTINAVGAPSELDIIELQDVEFVSLPWQEVEMEIGQNEPKYLVLNTDLVEIYDVNEDLEQLKFTSSSPIKSITLKDCYNHDDRGNIEANAEMAKKDGLFVYYIDKFGQKIQLGQDPGFAIKVAGKEWTKEEILAKEKGLYSREGVDSKSQYIRAEVPAGQEKALNGDIHIFSPIKAIVGNEDLNWESHFNTRRYLEFEVENIQGLTATFRVEQVPYILITHEEGFFSYRSDQKYSDDWEEASHFLNYKGGKTLHLSGLMWNYVYDWTNEPGEENTEYWGTDLLHRNYSWVPSHGTGLAHHCEVLHYGNIGVPHTFKDSRGVEVTYTYGGLYRPAVHPTDAFVRERYYLLADAQCNGIYSKGGYRFNSKNYDHPKGDVQGNAVGAVYEEDGKKYRKHFTWNVQPIFYNLYVSKVYDKEEYNPSNKLRTKGQSDINSMTHATDVSIDGEGTGWMSWGIQSYTNHRMYNVRTTTPQLGYTIGFPALGDKGITRNIPDNAVMISPNLQVASQLGETRYQSVLNEAAKYPTQYKVPEIGKFFKLAEEHCREYVETVYVGEEKEWWKDGQNTDKRKVVHYDDWRLPTKAEINKMIELQESSRAMDKLLVGQYYFCITGAGDDADINTPSNWVSDEITNFTPSMTGYYIRCVRDVNRTK